MKRFLRALRAPVAVCVLALCVPYSLDASVRTGRVPATANIFAADKSAVPAANGGAGTLPPGIRLPATRFRAVTVTALAGQVTCCNTVKPSTFNSPEGLPYTTKLTGVGGISGVSMNRAMALLGVFVGPGASSRTPATNNFTNQPAIGQVFYVPLRSPDGVPVEFIAPEGATRFHLGFADGFSFQGKPGWYGDNEGFFTATLTVRELKQVSIESVSNTCGGEGWIMAIPGAFRNTSEFSDGGPFADSFIVNWTAACNLHDAGYDGAIVSDTLNGGIANYRGSSRREVDDKFLDDLRLLCRKRISVKRPTALSRCLSRGGPGSFGAEYMYDLVRKHGVANFDSDPSQPGTQRTGPRTNN